MGNSTHTETKRGSLLATSLALQWAWASFFHESAYRTYEFVASPILLNYAITFCTSWTAGIAFGAFFVMLSESRGMPAIGRHLALSIQMTAGLLFYASLWLGNEPLIAVAMQFFLAATTCCSMLLSLKGLKPDVSRSLRQLPLVLVGMALVTQGILFMISIVASPILTAFLHLMLLPPAYHFERLARTRDINSKLESEEAGSAAKPSKAEMPSTSPSTSALTSAKSLNFIKSPRQPLWCHVFLYGLVFGTLHRLHGAVVTSPEIRTAAYFFGSLLAALLFLRFFGKEASAQSIWEGITRFVFPALMVSCLLMPLLNGTASFLVYLLTELSSSAYFLILLLACIYICQRAVLPLALAVGKMVFVFYFSMLAGGLIGTFIRVHLVFDMTFLGSFATAVFLLLVAATFELNVQGGFKTLWGLLVDHTPRALYDQRLDTLCARIAEEHALTNRELDVLKRLARNKRANDIKEELVLSVSTVRTHIQNIYAKADVHSHNELMNLVKDSMNSDK